jgi:DNA-binding NarL/FixJ family response regulator
MHTQEEPRPHEEPLRLRIIIADDDPLARRVVRDALQDAGVIVIAEAANGREAVELARHYRPDIVLMDIIMPGIDGLEATRLLAREVPDTAVLVLTASGDEDTGMLALRCGAAGFLSKDVDIAALPRALRGITYGEAAISRELTMRVIERFRRVRTDGAGLRPVQSVLSGREWEVLDHLCSGASTDDIADTLVLSTETVRSHIKNILRKLRVSSRAEAIAVARELREAVTEVDAHAAARVNVPVS